MDAQSGGFTGFAGDAAATATGAIYRDWEDSYPPIQEMRPPLDSWPVWYRIHHSDLTHMLARHERVLGPVRRIMDAGGGDGRRAVCALLANGWLNREDVHVDCIDLSRRATQWGVDLWERVRRGDYAGAGVPVTSPPARWSMSHRRESVLALPPAVRETQYDLWIDWMLFHGLPEGGAVAYARRIVEIRPKWFFLKCFSREGSSQGTLVQTVDGIPKRQWSQEDLIELFGSAFEIFGEPLQCGEVVDSGDPDGIRAAKREYCFRLRE